MAPPRHAATTARHKEARSAAVVVGMHAIDGMGWHATAEKAVLQEQVMSRRQPRQARRAAAMRQQETMPPGSTEDAKSAERRYARRVAADLPTFACYARLAVARPAAGAYRRASSRALRRYVRADI